VISFIVSVRTRGEPWPSASVPHCKPKLPRANCRGVFQQHRVSAMQGRGWNCPGHGRSQPLCDLPRGDCMASLEWFRRRLRRGPADPVRVSCIRRRLAACPHVHREFVQPRLRCRRLNLPMRRTPTGAGITRSEVDRRRALTRQAIEVMEDPKPTTWRDIFRCHGDV